MARDVTSSLNLHLQASPQQGPQGLALRGFYVQNKQRLIKRPIVYVNTAHHPGAISATFCHESGHHLTTAMFKPQGNEVHLFFDADYTAHLNDPLELAADVVVSLAGYPEPVARNIFASPWNWGLVAKTGETQRRGVRRRASACAQAVRPEFQHGSACRPEVKLPGRIGP